jgi:hypothetical protein
MPQRMTRLELFELVWSGPLTGVAPQFDISDVALKNSCQKFDIAVPREAIGPNFRLANLQLGSRCRREQPEWTMRSL